MSRGRIRSSGNCDEVHTSGCHEAHSFAPDPDELHLSSYNSGDGQSTTDYDAASIAELGPYVIVAGLCGMSIGMDIQRYDNLNRQWGIPGICRCNRRAKFPQRRRHNHSAGGLVWSIECPAIENTVRADQNSRVFRGISGYFCGQRRWNPRRKSDRCNV